MTILLTPGGSLPVWNSVAQREVVTIDNIKAWDGDSGKCGAIDNIGANCGLQRSIVVIIK